MYKRSISSLFTCFTLILLFSCTEKVDIDLRDQKEGTLVVEGAITNQTKAHQIKLTQMANYFDNQAPTPETMAKVLIYEEKNPTPIVLTEKSPGIYLTDSTVYGIPGKHYTLSITLKNGEKYEATALLKSVAPIDSISYDYQYVPWIQDTVYQLYLWSQEPKGLGDYYRWNIYLDGALDNDTLTETTYQDDRLVDGNYTYAYLFYYIPTKKLLKTNTPTKVEMCSITQDEYNFYIGALYETQFNGSMFSGPPANIPSNISNGGLGLFGAYSVSDYAFVLQKK